MKHTNNTTVDSNNMIWSKEIDTLNLNAMILYRFLLFKMESYYPLKHWVASSYIISIVIIS